MVSTKVINWCQNL